MSFRTLKFSRILLVFSLIAFTFIICDCKNVPVVKKEITPMASGKTKKEAKPKTSAKTKKETKPKKTSAKAKKGEDKQDDIIPDDGYIRLVLNQRKGSFTLYYLTDQKTMRYESLFSSKDSSSSLLSVIVDGEIYKLGSSNVFKKRIEKNGRDTALIFESSFLKVTQTFTPIRTSSAQAANGVMVTITMQNTATQRSFAGLRMLLDTTLGEGANGTPILTNKQAVSTETIIEGGSNERYWISRGKKVSLMGSIVSPVAVRGKNPDLVHIANWKSLRNAPWRLNYSQGQPLNKKPSRLGNSAVCYYFGPEMIDRNKTLTYTIFLTTEDVAWYKLAEPPVNMTASIISDTQARTQSKSEPVRNELNVNIPAIEAQAAVEASVTNENQETIVLLKLQDILNQFISGDIHINERDLTEIDNFLDKYRTGNETY